MLGCPAEAAVSLLLCLLAPHAAGGASAAGGPLSLGGNTHHVLPSQDMGVGLAVVPLMGLLETIAIAKAFGTAAPGSRALRRGLCRGLGVLGTLLFPRGQWEGLGCLCPARLGVGWQAGSRGCC